MVFDNARLLVRLLWKPADAMSGILDRGSLLFASIAVLAASLLLQFSLSAALPKAPDALQQTQAAKGDQDQSEVPVAPVRQRWSFSFYTPLLVLAVIYVPGTLLMTNLLAHLGGFGAVLERDYSTLLTCTSMAWAAVQIPLALAARLVPPGMLGIIAAVACLYFAVLMFFAVRTVFGTENKIAAGSVGLSVIPLAAGILALGPLRFMLSWLGSPFFLFYAFYFLRGEFTNMGAG